MQRPPESPVRGAVKPRESAARPQLAPESPSSATSKARDIVLRARSIPPIPAGAATAPRKLRAEFLAATLPVFAIRRSGECCRQLDEWHPAIPEMFSARPHADRP